MGLTARVVVPERLDALPPGDAAARGARQDLQRINAIMRQAPVMARLLRAHAPRPARRIVDLGAGDGAATLALARRLARDWQGVEVTLLDRHDLLAPDTRAGFAALGWRTRVLAADVFEWLEDGPAPFDAVLSNLFLHHFESRLPRLLAGISRLAPLFVATEPRRGRAALSASRLVGLIGANAVTRHDATASVRAGFAGRELTALWPGEDFRLIERRAGPFTHAFIARRAKAGR